MWVCRLFVLLLLVVPSGGVAGQNPRDLPFAWENATVYFVMTDRFQNGDPANDRAYGRGLDGAGRPYAVDESGHFHGGDFAGLTARIEDGYFDALGVSALWITAPYEQVHGWVGGGSQGDVQHYAYHGYWPLDFTEVDSALGTAADLRRLVDAAHARGIRVLLDVVLNHAGYNTLHDMAAYGFGTLRSDQWRAWRPGPGENWHTFNERFIDFTSSPGDWGRWWGPAWVRAPLPGYPACGDDDRTACLAYLPDFRTDAETPVGLPPLLTTKWGADKRAREEAALDAFFERTSHPRTPRYHLVKWLTDWVRAFGIDGFRIDTAKHVDFATWKALRREAADALRAWKSEHPDKALDERDFWMVGEVFGHGTERSAYFDQGFDAVINFSFQHEAARARSFEALDSLYTAYAARLQAAPGFNVLSYLSSHDTHLYDRDALVEAGTRLLLLPGAVQIFYGDETARPGGPAVSDPHQTTRSPMNWETADPDVLAHWQALGRFRRQHLAVGAGYHQRLPNSDYTFSRSYRDRTGLVDRVIVVLGAEGRTTVNVSRVFPDNALLRDAYTGQTAIVSFGMATFDAHPNGVLLIEEVP